jgi:Protein of unknown function (DUF1488)
LSVIFEARRLYVAPRKSVLFFAKVGDQRVRCYVQQDALVTPARGDEADLYQRCLLSFDQHRDAIQAAAMRLIDASVFDGRRRGDRFQNCPHPGSRSAGSGLRSLTGSGSVEQICPRGHDKRRRARLSGHWPIAQIRRDQKRTHNSDLTGLRSSLFWTRVRTYSLRPPRHVGAHPGCRGPGENVNSRHKREPRP